MHYPLQCSNGLQEAHLPLTLVVWQCTKGDSGPRPMQCGSVLKHTLATPL